MSLQQIWADNIIIQAVADAVNLKIHVIESSESFADITIIEGTSLMQHPRTYRRTTLCIYFASTFRNECHANCKKRLLR